MGEYWEELRGKVGKTRILVPGTGAIVLDEAQRVLLMLRSDRQEWGIPGGFMDLGETVRESLRRELREELGISSDEEKLFGVYSGSAFESTHPNGDQTASVSIVFIVRAYTGTPRNSDESLELRYVAINDLPEPMNQTSARILSDYQASLDGAVVPPIIL